MASTNKTTNLELSQYVSSDKPTYLVDYNSDMAKIDTGVHTAQVTADTASTAATNAQTTAEGAQTTANTAITNAATAQSGVVQNATNIGTLANLTTVEKTSLVGAINEVNAKTEVVDSMTGSETNKAPSVDSNKKYLKGDVLYEDSTGTYNNITLRLNGSNVDITGYDRVDIEYITNPNGAHLSETISANSSKIQLIANAETGGTYVAFKTLEYTVTTSQGSTTFTRAWSSAAILGSSSPINISNNDDSYYNIKIVKVIAYKY